MSRLSRDSWLALFLMLVLTAVTLLSVYQETQASLREAPLSSQSNQPDGAKALKLYLDEVGYITQNPTQNRFELASAIDVLFILAPQTNISPGEWREIESWVEAGGTLILAGADGGTNAALDHFDFRLRYLGSDEVSVIPQTPFMVSPTLPELPELTTVYALQSDRDDFVTHLATKENGRPVIVSWQQGNGRVILSATPDPFSNEGLQQPGNLERVLNLINAAEAPEIIFFDEWHHGLRGEEVAVTAGNWLQRTPAGRALLYTAVIVFLGLVLKGRLFGRPVPMPQDLTRRAPLEYISGIANLSRRAGHRQAVLQDYHHRLKRDLGFRYRLDPTLPDEEFVHRLAEYDTAVDKQELLSLLSRLKTTTSEHEMVQAAAQATQYGEN